MHVVKNWIQSGYNPDTQVTSTSLDTHVTLSNYCLFDCFPQLSHFLAILTTVMRYGCRNPKTTVALKVCTFFLFLLFIYSVNVAEKCICSGF